MSSFLNQTLWKGKEFLKNIGNNIIFYPASIGISGFLLGIFLDYVEKIGVTAFFVDKAPFLVINNYDTASTLLSYLSGGIISIMVFSFSMVMLLLNQAASNFSPRVLPGLISVRKHQYILGLYLGTLLYNTSVMVGLKPTTDQYQLPGFSILIGIVLTVISLFAFIFFIDSISKSIQVQSILYSIFEKTKNRMRLVKEQESNTAKDTAIDYSYGYTTQASGYLRNINEEALIEFCAKKKCNANIHLYKGAFVSKGMKLLSTDVEIDKDDLAILLGYFDINRDGENVAENYVLGFKQIAEIGIRAMSPGINDPGTAISTIDYLTELLSIRLDKEDVRYRCKEGYCLKVNIISFHELLTQLMASYRTYCKADITCVQKLYLMLEHLKAHPKLTNKRTETINLEIEKLRLDAHASIQNAFDYALLEDLMNNS